MNNDRRKRIAVEVADMETVAIALNNLLENINGIKDEEQEYLDNMPESLQNSERGEAATEAIDIMEEVAGAIEALLDIGPDERLSEAAN